MQHLEVSGAVRPLKWSLGVKWLKVWREGSSLCGLFVLSENVAKDVPAIRQIGKNGPGFAMRLLRHSLILWLKCRPAMPHILGIKNSLIICTVDSNLHCFRHNTREIDIVSKVLQSTPYNNHSSLTQKQTYCHDLEISLQFSSLACNVLSECKWRVRSLSATSCLLPLFKEN